MSPNALFFASILISSGTIIPLTFAQNDILDSPLKQFRGIVVFVHNVKCKVGLTLVIKASNSSPACVKPQTIPNLEERGWALLEKQMVWFVSIQSSRPWNELQSGIAVAEPLLMQAYFVRQNITIIDAKVSGSTFYFLVSESEVDKMIKLGYKELATPPPSTAINIDINWR